MTQFQASRKRANRQEGRAMRAATSEHWRLRLVRLIVMAVALMAFPVSPEAAHALTASVTSVRASNTVTFGYTGGNQTFTVPVGIRTVTVEAWGAQGGHGYRSTNAGKGGYVKATVPVNEGESLIVQVGGQGLEGTRGVDMAGGWPDGGDALNGDNWGGGSGGGSSKVRRGNTLLTVAGGGGGSSGENGEVCEGCLLLGGGGGGGGGGYFGGGGGSGGQGNLTGGGGGSQAAGGVKGTGDTGMTNHGTTDGSLGKGGDGGKTVNFTWLNDYNNSPGGHGGGDIGGTGASSGGFTGSHRGGGGGGGSSNVNSSAGANTLANDQGVRTGNGLVRIFYWSPQPPPTTDLVGPAPGTQWSTLSVQQFIVTATDPNDDAYRGYVTVENTASGDTFQYQTGLTPSGQNATVTPTPKLPTGSYRWKAKACDEPPLPYPAGCTLETGWSYFSVGDPPSALQVSPVEGHTYYAMGNQPFTVTAHDPSAHAYRATIEVATSVGSVLATLTTTSTPSGSTATASPPQPLSTGNYKWRAKACKTIAPTVCSEFTGYRTFTVSNSNTPPNTPTPSLPTSGHTFGGNDPQVFSVEAIDPNNDAYHGRVTVIASAGGNPITFDLAMIASGQPSAGSPPARFGDGTYTWTAVACDPAGSDGCSGPSTSRSFTVTDVTQGNSAPDAPQVIDPMANSVFEPAERQDFILRTTDPNGDLYSGDIVFRNALTGEPAPQRVQTHLAPSGANSTGTLGADPLPPGSWTMEATASDAHSAGSPATVQTIGVADTAGTPCTASGALVDGYFGDRYLQIGTATVDGVAYVCLKTAQGLDRFAGWLRAEAGGSGGGGGVPTVGTSLACPDSGEGLTPFPLLDQTVGPPAAQTELWAALRKTGAALTACFKVKVAGSNLLDHAVTIQAPAGASLSKLDFVPQATPGSWSPPAEVAPATGLPSSECYTATSGKTRYVNAKVDGQHVWLYSQQESGIRRLCSRIQGASSQGVVVREHADNVGDPAVWQVGLPVDDASSPCTADWSLYESNSPYHARLWTSAPDGDPLGVCVSAGLSGPILASWLKVDRSPNGSVTSHALDS